MEVTVVEHIADIVKDLAALPTEREWLEFKENWYDPNALGEYISSLSNAAAMHGRGCAYMVWGVEDGTHRIVGTRFDFRRNVNGEPLEHYLARTVTPDVGFSFHEGYAEGERVVLLEIPAATLVPTAFSGVRYLRIGSSKVNLARYPERESRLFDVLRNGLPTVSTVESRYQGLTFSRLFTIYAGRGIGLKESTFEENLGLRTRDGKYNVLAQLLSDDSRIPVRFSIFRGPTKASPLYSVREFGNTCILLSLDKVLEYGDVLNIVQADERGRVVERKDVRLFSERAWREAVINAFVHNKWVEGDAPAFSLFDNRVEVLSHGALREDQTREGFFEGVSKPVNQALSDIFLQLHISERSGRGVPAIVEECGRGAFRFGENHIIASLPFTRVDEVAYSRSHANAAVMRLNGGLSRSEELVLAAMRDNPSLTQGQIATATGLARSTVQRAAKSLQDAGFIERVGSRKTGWWKVIEADGA